MTIKTEKRSGTKVLIWPNTIRNRGKAKKDFNYMKAWYARGVQAGINLRIYNDSFIQRDWTGARVSEY